MDTLKLKPTKKEAIVSHDTNRSSWAPHEESITWPIHSFKFCICNNFSHIVYCIAATSLLLVYAFIYRYMVRSFVGGTSKFQLHTQFWPWDRIGHYLIWLANANDKTLSPTNEKASKVIHKLSTLAISRFKLRVEMQRNQSQKCILIILFFTQSHKPSKCVDFWTYNDVYIKTCIQ